MHSSSSGTTPEHGLEPSRKVSIHGIVPDFADSQFGEQVRAKRLWRSHLNSRNKLENHIRKFSLYKFGNFNPLRGSPRQPLVAFQNPLNSAQIIEAIASRYSHLRLYFLYFYFCTCKSTKTQFMPGALGILLYTEVGSRRTFLIQVCFCLSLLLFTLLLCLANLLVWVECKAC